MAGSWSSGAWRLEVGDWLISPDWGHARNEEAFDAASAATGDCQMLPSREVEKGKMSSLFRGDWSDLLCNMER